MTIESIQNKGCCGSDSSCSTSGCTGEAKTCKKEDCCKKSSSQKSGNKCDKELEDGTKCGTELKSGMKYKNVCTKCNPEYKPWCSGCDRRLWDCMCIKPHTWE